MNDIYETRKHDQSSMRLRPECDKLPGLPSAGCEILNGIIPIHLVQSMHNASIPSSALLSIEPNSNEIRSALGMHETEPFASACAVIWHKAEQILGGPCYIHQSRINFKRAVVGTGWSWHSDFETWHAQDGMRRPMAVSAMIPLDVNTPDNGPLFIIPGSHMLYWSAPRGEEHSAEDNFSDQKDGVPTDDVILAFKRACGEEVAVLAEPGDVFFFDCNLMHSSQPNKSLQDRANFYVVFNRSDNELVEPFSTSAPRPIEMGFRK